MAILASSKNSNRPKHYKIIPPILIKQKNGRKKFQSKYIRYQKPTYASKSYSSMFKSTIQRDVTSQILFKLAFILFCIFISSVITFHATKGTRQNLAKHVQDVTINAENNCQEEINNNIEQFQAEIRERMETEWRHKFQGVDAVQMQKEIAELKMKLNLANSNYETLLANIKSGKL